MRLLLIALAVLVFCGALWGPATYVAWRFWRRGEMGALRQLRFVLPAQLLAAVALAFTADVLGMRQPAALLAGATLMVSAAGAAGLALYFRFLGR